MPLLYSAGPFGGIARDIDPRLPPSIRRDTGIISARYQRGSPGGAGYFRGAMTPLATARKKFTRQPPTREPVGPGTQQRGEILRTGMNQPSRYQPKRLWNYQFANLAPANTTLGRMRTLYSGFNPTMLRA